MIHRTWTVLSAAVTLGLFATQAAAQAPVQLTLWEVQNLPAEVRAFNRIATEFTKSHPGITVKVVTVAGGETDSAKLTAAVAANRGPDIYLLDRFTVAERASAGLLEDLTPYLGGQNLANSYLPFAWNETQFQNKTYGLPFDTDARVLFYRKDILRQAGVDLAPFNPAKGPMNIKAFQAIAMKLNKTNSKGQYTQVGFIPWLNQGWHYTWGYAFGGSFADVKACKVTPTNAGVEAGFQFLSDWAKAMDPQKAQAFVTTYAPQNYPPAQDPFVTGRAAMVITGDWMLSTMKEFAPKAEYGVTYIPTPDGQKTSWSGGWSVVMPRGAKHPKETVEFIKFMAGQEGQRIYSRDSSHLPTWKALLSDKSAVNANEAFFQTLLPNSKSRPALPVGALYWDELTRAQNSVTLGQSDPKTALAQVESRVQPRLNRFCK